MAAHILFLNGSLRGSTGNTSRLLERARLDAPAGTTHETISLAEYTGTVEALAARLVAADAFLFGSGVYWGSWGSPLQRFLEVITSYELSPCFLGKAAGAVVSADSVGGLDVAQRVLGACTLLGCIVPPLSTVVVSRVAVAAAAVALDGSDDVWQPDDLRVVMQNLVAAADATRGVQWATWPVRALARLEGPYPSHGVLASGLAKFA